MRPPWGRDRGFEMEPTMGTLLQFLPRRRSAEAHPPAARGPADILLFTGVRYEHGDAAEPPRPAEEQGGPDRRVQPS